MIVVSVVSLIHRTRS